MVVSLSAFGLTGPRASEQSSEFLLQALSGSLHNHGSTEGLPLAVGGAVAEWAVGTYGALGAVSALSALVDRASATSSTSPPSKPSR